MNIRQSALYVFESVSYAGGMGGIVGCVVLWHEKFRVKQFSNTPCVKYFLNPEFAAFSYYQAAKITAIYGASTLGLAVLAQEILTSIGKDENTALNGGKKVLFLSGIVGGAYLYTRNINVLKIAASIFSTSSLLGLFASFGVKLFTQKKLLT